MSFVRVGHVPGERSFAHVTRCAGRPGIPNTPPTRCSKRGQVGHASWWDGFGHAPNRLINTSAARTWPADSYVVDGQPKDCDPTSARTTDGGGWTHSLGPVHVRLPARWRDDTVGREHVRMSTTHWYVESVTWRLAPATPCQRGRPACLAGASSAQPRGTPI